MSFSPCRSNIQVPQGHIEHHLSICSAIAFSIGDLKIKTKGKIFKKLSSSISTEDVFLLKEMLLISAKQELLKQIKNSPVDIELHVEGHDIISVTSKDISMKGVLYRDRSKNSPRQALSFENQPCRGFWNATARYYKERLFE